jgi:hypothetical protein
MQAQRLSFTEAKREKLRKLTKAAQTVMIAKLAARPHQRAAYSACADVWLEVGKRIAKCSLSDVVAAGNTQRDLYHGANPTTPCPTSSSFR